MSKLRKIMAMVIASVMMLSVGGVSVFAAEDIIEKTVELNNTKEQIIEWDLKEDTWYSMSLQNDSSNQISAILTGEGYEKLPALYAGVGSGMTVSSTDKSEPLKAGKYKITIKSLGDDNLIGTFSYRLSANKDYFPKKSTAMIMDTTGKENVILYNVSEGKNADNVLIPFHANPDNDAMYALQQYGIIEGDPNGDLRPYSTITRAEMAKVLCKMLGLTPVTNNGQTFSDVDASHWAFGYIEGAWSGAVAEGKGDGTFGPEDNILFKDAVKMIVSAMGYMPKAEQMGGYPHGYAMVASQLGVTADIDHALDVECNRNTVFKMLHNSLDVPFMLQVDSGANVEYQIADGQDGRQHITFRGKITGNPIKVEVYDKEYMDELNKFMDGGEYYDEIAKGVEKMRDAKNKTGEYTFSISQAEMNKDATEVILYITVSPDGENDGITYYVLTYKKVDGKWNF